MSCLVSSVRYGDFSSSFVPPKLPPYPSFGLSPSLGGYGSGPASGPSYNRLFPGYNIASGNNFGLQGSGVYTSDYKILSPTFSGVAPGRSQQYPGFNGASSPLLSGSGFNSYSGNLPRVGMSALPVVKTVQPYGASPPVGYQTGSFGGYDEPSHVGKKPFTLYGQSEHN